MKENISKELIAKLRLSRADSISESIINKLFFELFGSTSNNTNNSNNIITNQNNIISDFIFINKYSLIDNEYINNSLSGYTQKEIDTELIQDLFNVIIINISYYY